MSCERLYFTVLCSLQTGSPSLTMLSQNDILEEVLHKVERAFHILELPLFEEHSVLRSAHCHFSAALRIERKQLKSFWIKSVGTSFCMDDQSCVCTGTPPSEMKFHQALYKQAALVCETSASLMNSPLSHVQACRSTMPKILGAPLSSI